MKDGKKEIQNKVVFRKSERKKMKIFTCKE